MNSKKDLEVSAGRKAAFYGLLGVAIMLVIIAIISSFKKPEERQINPPEPVPSNRVVQAAPVVVVTKNPKPEAVIALSLEFDSSSLAKVSEPRRPDTAESNTQP